MTMMSDLMQMEPKDTTSPEQAWKLVQNELDTTDTSVLRKADTQDNVDEFLKEPVLVYWSDMQGLDW